MFVSSPLPLCLFISLPLCLSLYPSVSLSFYLCLSVSLSLFTLLPDSPYFCLFVFLSVCPSIPLCFSLSLLSLSPCLPLSISLLLSLNSLLIKGWGKPPNRKLQNLLESVLIFHNKLFLPPKHFGIKLSSKLNSTLLLEKHLFHGKNN